MLVLVCVGGAFGRVPDPQPDPGAGTIAPEMSPPTPMGQSPKSTISGSLTQIFEQIEDQDPIRRAGLKASVLRQAQVTIPMVVVVEDADSYLYAISNWEGMLKFPVLWDDGTSESHEDIARFVRSFQPKEVVMLSGHVESPWSNNRDDRQAIFESVLGQAMNASHLNWRHSLKALADQGVVSPGVVVSDVHDTAWPAALALAAGRMQPVIFVKKTTRVRTKLSIEDSDTLERLIERGVEATGYSWRSIGDEIDAITLAVNTGTMIQTGDGARDRIATTDRIGRFNSGGSGERWAYCGQIIGNESRAAYQAMCSLFLSIDQGFIWDGYNSQQPWVQYDGTQASDTLKKVNFEVEINDEPRNTLRDWKLRMVRPVGHVDRSPGSSGVFLMNSKGAANVFDVPGTVDGQGKPGHMPIFNVPSILHIVHSFSLQSPTNRNTIGGRLLERGVYAYAGSVDEPYLSAFVPTPAIARRLAGSLCFAAAVRFDDGKVWKVTVLGDPLVTFGSAGRRTEDVIAVPGSVVLGERYKLALKAGEYQSAIEDLTMLGRDESAARIAMALIKDQPGGFSPEMAKASIPALYRTGEYTSVMNAYERLDGDGQIDNLMQDILWLSSPYLLARASGDPAERSRIFALLRSNIRSAQKIHDAEDLAMAMRRVSIADAVGVLESLRPTLNTSQSKMLDRAIRRVRK